MTKEQIRAEVVKAFEGKYDPANPGHDRLAADLAGTTGEAAGGDSTWPAEGGDRPKRAELAKHTPGPWKVSTTYKDFAAGRAAIVPWSDQGRTLAEVRPIKCYPASEVAANARLIAAAPDLLAACKRMVRASENHGSRKQMMNAAMIELRAAIARAEGGV